MEIHRDPAAEFYSAAATQRQGEGQLFLLPRNRSGCAGRGSFQQSAKKLDPEIDSARRTRRSYLRKRALGSSSEQVLWLDVEDETQTQPAATTDLMVSEFDCLSRQATDHSRGFEERRAHRQHIDALAPRHTCLQVWLL